MELHLVYKAMMAKFFEKKRRLKKQLKLQLRVAQNSQHDLELCLPDSTR
jgi:hypothetical protein